MSNKNCYQQFGMGKANPFPRLNPDFMILGLPRGWLESMLLPMEAWLCELRVDSDFEWTSIAASLKSQKSGFRQGAGIRVVTTEYSGVTFSNEVYPNKLSEN